VGEARPGPGAEERIRPITTASGETSAKNGLPGAPCESGAPGDVTGPSRKNKPAAERLYGRTRGSKLRPRQQALLDLTLPRLLLDYAGIADPGAAFARRLDALWLEIGFGGGEHARAQAAAHPEIGLIACEVYENGICSLLSALVPDGDEATAPLPGNLRLWDDDARLLLRRLPAGCLDRLFLLFPDPWPKLRHAKRRFVHPDNLPLVARALRPGGEWRIASDDPTYQAWTAEVLAQQMLFNVVPPVEQRPAGWPPTRYERKAELAGRPALYWRAIRSHAEVP
jgi:tRNA (guanine-N7-)-methyltransferase